jgi:DNA-binding MarR family transcriptional regulator
MAEQVRWLDEPEMRAWRALIGTTTGLLATLDNELQAAHGLSLGDYEVLVVLSEAPGNAVRMSELAGRLHLSPSGITRRIDGLARNNLVRRETCETDRRGANAVLTDKGRQVLARAAPTHVRGVREHLIDRLSPRQLANLASALSSVDINSARAAGGCGDAR